MDDGKGCVGQKQAPRGFSAYDPTTLRLQRGPDDPWTNTFRLNHHIPPAAHQAGDAGG